jgi:UDP-N-acetylmuramoylalanine--D-glutamate ligase
MIGVIGYGRSGKAVARLIESLGEVPFISDSKKDLSSITWPHEWGEHTEKLLEMEQLVVSPGVPLDIPVLREAREKGISVIGEIEFASRFLKGKIVAITGTNGKTTTAAMTYHLLKESFNDRVLLGGNIYPGEPLSSLVERSRVDSITVTEVSSFQLEGIKSFHPWIATIVNVSADHLDRHSDFEEYLRAKLNIFKNQTRDDYSVLNKDDKNLSSLVLPTKILYFSLSQKSDIYYNGSLFVKDRHDKKVFSKDDLFMPGKAFIEDGMIASLIASIVGLEWEEIRNRIKSFSGVPHRMETVIKKEGLWVINNSMCTNPVAFVKSLECFPDSCVIVGGRMKVSNLSPIVRAIEKMAKFAVIIGESSELIREGLKNTGFKDWVVASSMEDAVKKALSSKCDRIILSPGASSFDWFRDFEERGEVFKRLVREMYV